MHVLIKPGVLAEGWCTPGSLILLFVQEVDMCLCVGVYPTPKLLITSGMMWHDMDPI